MANVITTTSSWDETYIIHGDVSTIDESFDHEFGVERQSSYEVSDVRVFNHIGGSVSIVEISEKQMEKFKELLIEKYIEEYEQ